MSNTIIDNNNLKQLLGASSDSAKQAFDPARVAKSKLDQQSLLDKATLAGEDAFYEPSSRGVDAAAAMVRAQSAYQYSETMSLQLTTKEGDKVSVDFRQLYAHYQSYSEMKTKEEGPQGVRYFESREMLESTQFEEHFGFSVEGELSEEELQAIYDVFEQVDALANQFFSGNIEMAFQKAMELEIDFAQLDSFKLNLTQTEMRAVQYQQAAMAQYNEVKKQQAEESAEDYGVEMDELPGYLQQWQQALDHLEEHFENARDFLDGLVGDVAAQRFPEQDSKEGWLERVKVFHEKLVEYAEQSAESETRDIDSIEQIDNEIHEYADSEKD